MRDSVVKLLACPRCGSRLERVTAPESAESQTAKDELVCRTCQRRYPVVDGVPDFLENTVRDGHVAKSFGFEWTLHHKGAFERQTVFGRTLEEDLTYFYDALGLPEGSVSGIVLDAGCGSGVLTIELARRNPDATVIAMDINEALREVHERGKEMPNLHVIRASVFEPPFRDGSIDYLWSNGVIHHTGDTKRAFGALTSKVKPGGKAYIWVYERKVSPMVALRLMLLPLGVTRWNRWLLYRFCQIVSAPTWLAVKVLKLLRALPFVRSNTHLRILTLDRTYDQLVLTWFDVLSPKYRDTLSNRTFESWFIKRGFKDMRHYHWPVGICAIRAEVDCMESGTPAPELSGAVA